ncbi:hypothetical protein ABIB44_002609 [Hymenobacter sp. UYCo722]
MTAFLLRSLLHNYLNGVADETQDVASLPPF